MSLLDKIRKISPQAAKNLEDEGFSTDSDIKSLTREELVELLPGPRTFRLRKKIFETIHEQKPIEALLKELKGFIPHEYFRDSLTNNGVMVDYLRILREMKTHMKQVQDFLEAHINFLEELSKDQPTQESDKGINAAGTSVSLMNPRGQTGDLRHRAPEESYSHNNEHNMMHSMNELSNVPAALGQPMQLDQQTSKPQGERQVRYRMLVCSKTLNAHQQLMKIVTNGHEVRFVETPEDHQITVLFCTFVSRIATDVDTAMSNIKDDKPVILVIMHHAYEPRNMRRTWDQHSNIVLGVNVFFHETKHGLLTCEQNNTAVTMIQNKMAEYCTLKPDTSRTAQIAYSNWKSNLQQTSQYPQDAKRSNKDQGSSNKDQGSSTNGFLGLLSGWTSNKKM